MYTQQIYDGTAVTVPFGFSMGATFDPNEILYVERFDHSDNSYYLVNNPELLGYGYWAAYKDIEIFETGKEEVKEVGTYSVGEKVYRNSWTNVEWEVIATDGTWYWIKTEDSVSGELVNGNGLEPVGWTKDVTYKTSWGSSFLVTAVDEDGNALCVWKDGSVGGFAASIRSEHTVKEK